MIEDLTGALTSGKPALPANPSAAQQAQYDTDLKAFNSGVAFVLKQFPGGASGNMQSRTMGNNIAMGKIDYLINPSNTLSTFFNYMRSHGERAIQTPIVLGNVPQPLLQQLLRGDTTGFHSPSNDSRGWSNT